MEYKTFLEFFENVILEGMLYKGLFKFKREEYVEEEDDEENLFRDSNDDCENGEGSDGEEDLSSDFTIDIDDELEKAVLRRTLKWLGYQHKRD